MMEDNRIDFNKVGIDASFMFGYIMQNAVRCKAFLEQILNIKIDHIEYPEKEKMIGMSTNEADIIKGR